MQNASEIPFVIAGSGPMEEMCRNTGLKNVTFVGFQTGKQLETLIREAAFSLCLSICYENCPLSVLESQQYGTPVIGNRIGGIPELIEEGTTGLLNNEFIPESYARTIKGLYENHDLLWQMTENCRKRKFMGLKEYTEQMVEIYQQVIAEHVKRGENRVEKSNVSDIQFGKRWSGTSAAGYCQSSESGKIRNYTSDII